MSEFDDEKFSLDDVSEVSGGVVTEETIARWNAEYEIYKDMIMPGTTVCGTVSDVPDYGVFVNIVPGTLMTGLDGGYDRHIEVGDPVDVQIRYVNPETMRIRLHIVNSPW